MVMPTYPTPETEGREKDVKPSRGRVFWEIFWRTTAMGVSHGATSGALFGVWFFVIWRCLRRRVRACPWTCLGPHAGCGDVCMVLSSDKSRFVSLGCCEHWRGRLLWDSMGSLRPNTRRLGRCQYGTRLQRSDISGIMSRRRRRLAGESSSGGLVCRSNVRR